jgi:hypothetical protein
MSNEGPQPSVNVEQSVLAAMHRLAIGDTLRVNGAREVVERVSDDRWLLSIELEHSGDRVPAAYLSSDGQRIEVPAPIETVEYDLLRLDGTRVVGKAVVDEVVGGVFYCSPSIEPDGTDTQGEDGPR